VLASRPISPTDRVHRSARDRAVDGSERPHGLHRIGQAYGLSLLAAVLGLPVLAAGLITSNNCELRGVACSGRLVYGLIGAVVLAAVVQLVLLLHFRLGWLCWAVVAAVTATVLLYPTEPLVVVAAALVAPGVGAWVSEPPRPGVDAPAANRLPRLLLLAAVLAAAVVPALVDWRH
jgi:hypothetical protein